MPPSTPPSDSAPVRVRTRSWLRTVAVLTALLLFAVLLQWLSGAYRAEFGAFPDESAHFVTGLMFRDYVASGFPESPIKYAEDYYFHYPKVAFGVWGPLLYAIEGTWMLVFPPSHISILLLMSLIIALAATLLYRVLTKETGPVLALMAALIFLAIPVVQSSTGMVMADGLVALLDFCAALAFGKYLTSNDWRYSALFGAFASLSILTKSTGVALVLLPGFAILLTRQFRVLKKPSLWIAPAIIACIGGPWEYYSSKLWSGLHERFPIWSFAGNYTALLITIAGIALLPLIAIGFYDRVAAPALKRGADGKWAAAGALILSVWLFHCAVPAAGPEPRYLIAVLPPMLMCAAAGIGVLARLLPSRISLQHRTWGVGALACIVFLVTEFSIPQKSYHGFDEVAERLESPEFANSVILISSEADGEGMLITEMAMRERRPSHIILRATKMLSQSNWNGEHYRLLYATPQELMTFLQSVPVEVVVIHNERTYRSFPDQALLRRAIASFQNDWEHLGTFPQRRPTVASTIDIYRLKSSAGHRRGKIRIELPYTRGHAIERELP